MGLNGNERRAFLYNVSIDVLKKKKKKNLPFVMQLVCAACTIPYLIKSSFCSQGFFSLALVEPTVKKGDDVGRTKQKVGGRRK